MATRVGATVQRHTAIGSPKDTGQTSEKRGLMAMV
ncbi:hypothetical protein HaLaN_18132, partial [Haematococcus lacustris]